MPENGFVQWGWREMEELLQCPVCLDVPSSGSGTTVEQCVHGHHICGSCKTKVANCPLCKSTFLGTRNFVVEELVRHYEILKNTMMLNGIVPDQKLKQKIESTKLDVTASTTKCIRRNVNTPDATKGTYPCGFPGCETILPSGRLLNHVRSYHADVLTESVVDFTDSYTQNWEIIFRNKKPINRYCYIIFVSGIGLVFINIEILRSGQLVAAVQMAMKYGCAKNFLASLEFFSESNTYCFNTRLSSIRDPIQNVMERKHCYTLSKNQLRNLCVNKKFHCKMRLSRFNDVDINLLTKPNIEQINVVSKIRASLITEEKDKKLIKELEKYNVTKNSNTSKSIRDTATSSQAILRNLNQMVKETSASTNGNNHKHESQCGLAVSATPATQSKKKQRNRNRRNGTGSQNAN